MAITSTPVDQLTYHQKNRDTLISFIDRQLKVLDTLHLDALKANLQQLRARVCTDHFKILVMGEFKRGKSTFINAMLGKKVLPAFATPTTAIITEVKWGEPPKALLHLLPSRPGTLGAAQEIPVDQINRYVVIDEEDSRRQQPYEKIELFWPLEICRNSVEVIDSPGLNEDKGRQDITINYLAAVDAIIFVVLCTAVGSMSEISTLSGLQALGKDNLFFVCNRINDVDPEEVERVKNHCIKALSQYTKQGAQSIFFLNARGALEARLNGNTEQLKQSGILPVESELKTFLVNERGRIKIVQPAIELRASLAAVRKVIPDKEKLHRENLETIQSRYEKTQKDLEQLERERQQVVLRLTHFRTDTRMCVNDSASRFYSRAADKVPGWLEKYEVTNKLGIMQLFSKEAREKLVHEVTQFLTNQLSNDMKAWQDSELQPELKKRYDLLKQELDTRTSKFLTGLDQVRLELVGSDSVKISGHAAQPDKVSPLERVLATAGGFLVGDIGSASLGAVFGFKEMLKSIIPQMVLVGVTVALASFNPLVLISVMLGGSAVQALFKVNSISKQIQAAVGKEYERNLRDSRIELANQFATNIDKQFSNLQATLDKGLGLEIQNIRDQVNAIINEKQQGQAKVNQALRELTTIASELNAIDSAIDNLIREVIS